MILAGGKLAERLFSTVSSLLIDIHTHTFPKSDDSFLSPEQLITEAKRVGLDGICLTDHDGFWDAVSITELSREYDFPIFPGCEVTTEEAHLLVFGLDRYIFGMHRASFVREQVDRCGGVVVVAHPYRRLFREEEAASEDGYRSLVDRACQSEVFGLVDGVEVFNGRGSDAENAFALDISKRFNLNGTGASDAHKLEDVGTFATDFLRTIKTVEELIAELKSGRFQPVVMEKRQSLARGVQ